MTPEMWTAVVNGGSAVAVIIVVVIFLKANERRDESFLDALKVRDAQWQDFFMVLHKGDSEAAQKTGDALDRVLQFMTDHDNRMMHAIVTMQERTRPVTSHTRRGDTHEGGMG